jgi:muramidase (phage lysozyme)
MTGNERAFLDAIAHSEIGEALLSETDNGYNVIVGSTPEVPSTFSSYADHPRKLVRLNASLYSTAAGRYQLLEHWYDAYKKLLGLPDFSPSSQDEIALQQIKECNALDDINAGNFAGAVAKCAHIWASLPGAGYDQHENKLADLQLAYINAGGTVQEA